MLKKIIIIFSFLFNALFALFIVFSFTRKTTALTLYDPSEADRHYTAGALVVSVPRENADLSFGPVEFTLKPGEEAALQFSLLVDRRQLNVALELLYDRGILSIEPTGYGVLIQAKQPGRAVLQVFSGNGIRDVAIVTVGEAAHE